MQKVSVGAQGTGVVGKCTNIEVRDCAGSGVFAFGDASITLIGAKTTVHGNCTNGGSAYYGLNVDGPLSTIQLVPPLTKKTVSTNNGGGGNYGAKKGGDINQIKTMPSSSPAPPATIRVPADCKTLNEAVERVHKDRRLTTILVSKGTHVVETDAKGFNYLVVCSSMNIIGDPDVSNNEIIILGGFAIAPDIQGMFIYKT